MRKRMPYVKMKSPDGREWYFRWSPVTDSPTTEAMTRAELIGYLRATGWPNGEIRRALRRLRKRGTNAPGDRGPVDTIEPVNRAGRGGTWLTAEQQLQLALLWREDPLATIEGVPQDEICSGCCKPVACAEERSWHEGEPFCPACAEKLRGGCDGVRAR